MNSPLAQCLIQWVHNSYIANKACPRHPYMFINENYSSKFATMSFRAPAPKRSAEISIPKTLWIRNWIHTHSLTLTMTPGLTLDTIYIIYIHIYIYKIYIYIYIYIYKLKLFKETFFKKSVIFRILRIFNELLQTKSVKKYILTE